MRVSGVELPEHTLIAPWMLPAEICERTIERVHDLGVRDR